MNLFMFPFGPFSQYMVEFCDSQWEQQKPKNFNPPFPKEKINGLFMHMLEDFIGLKNMLYIIMFITYFCLAFKSWNTYSKN